MGLDEIIDPPVGKSAGRIEFLVENGIDRPDHILDEAGKRVEMPAGRVHNAHGVFVRTEYLGDSRVRPGIAGAELPDLLAQRESSRKVDPKITSRRPDWTRGQAIVPGQPGFLLHHVGSAGLVSDTVGIRKIFESHIAGGRADPMATGTVELLDQPTASLEDALSLRELFLHGGIDRIVHQADDVGDDSLDLLLVVMEGEEGHLQELVGPLVDQLGSGEIMVDLLPEAVLALRHPAGKNVKAPGVTQLGQGPIVAPVRNRLGAILLVSPLAEIEPVRALVSPFVQLRADRLRAVKVGDLPGVRRPGIRIEVLDPVVAPETAVASNETMPHQLELLPGSHIGEQVTGLFRSMLGAQVKDRDVIEELLLQRISVNLSLGYRHQAIPPGLIPVCFIAITKAARRGARVGGEIDIVEVQGQQVADHVRHLPLTGGVFAWGETEPGHDRLRIVLLGIEDPAGQPADGFLAAGSGGQVKLAGYRAEIRSKGIVYPAIVGRISKQPGAFHRALIDLETLLDPEGTLDRPPGFPVELLDIHSHVEALEPVVEVHQLLACLSISSRQRGPVPGRHGLLLQRRQHGTERRERLLVFALGLHLDTVAAHAAQGLDQLTAARGISARGGALAAGSFFSGGPVEQVGREPQDLDTVSKVEVDLFSALGIRGPGRLVIFLRGSHAGGFRIQGTQHLAPGIRQVKEPRHAGGFPEMGRLPDPAGEEIQRDLVPEMLQVGADLVELPNPVIGSARSHLEAFNLMATEAAVGANELLAQVQLLGSLDLPLIAVTLGAAGAGEIGGKHRVIIVMLLVPVIPVFPMFLLLLIDRRVGGDGEIDGMPITVVAGGAADVEVVVRTGGGEEQIETGMAGVDRTPFLILVSDKAGRRIVDVDVAGLAAMDPLDIHEVQRFLELGGDHLVDLVVRRHEVEQGRVAKRVSHRRIDQPVLLKRRIDNLETTLQPSLQGGEIGRPLSSGVGGHRFQLLVVSGSGSLGTILCRLQYPGLDVERLDRAPVELLRQLPYLFERFFCRALRQRVLFRLLEDELGRLEIPAVGAQRTIGFIEIKGFLAPVFAQSAESLEFRTASGILQQLLHRCPQFFNPVGQLSIVLLRLPLQRLFLFPRELRPDSIEPGRDLAKGPQLAFPGHLQSRLGLLDLDIPPVSLDMFPLTIVILPEDHQGDDEQGGARNREGYIQGGNTVEGGLAVRLGEDTFRKLAEGAALNKRIDRRYRFPERIGLGELRQFGSIWLLGGSLLLGDLLRGRNRLRRGLCRGRRGLGSLGLCSGRRWRATA